MDSTTPSMYSPSWKKPSDIMKNFRIRKKALQARIDNQRIYDRTTFNDNSTEKQQCINPFRKLQSTEKNLETESELSSDVTLFQLLNKRQSVPTLSSSNLNLNHRFQVKETSQPQNNSVNEQVRWENHLPVDWSLKTRLRLVSPTSFPWNTGTRKTTEEASGTTSFVRCLHSYKGELDTSASAELHQRCLVWQHPSLPWLKLFPVQNKWSSMNPLMSNVEFQEALFADWCNSLRSLFQLLRSRQCPFFYLCAQEFTVLFRAAGIAGISDVHVMISPTTRGLRKSMKDEGITFSLPLRKSSSNSSEDSTDTSSNDTSSSGVESTHQLDNIDVDDDDDMELWLANAGLEHILAPSSNRLGNEDKVKDHHPESLAYIESSEVQSFFNFLLNEKRLCVPTIGSRAGVPATLLSPVGFLGGTLRSLSVKQISAQRKDETQHYLDIQGPILPHLVHTLAQLNSAQNISKYTMLSSTLPKTSSFSTNITAPFVPPAFAKQSLLDCGLDPDVLETFCSLKKCSTVQEIKFQNGKFNCR